VLPSLPICPPQAITPVPTATPTPIPTIPPDLLGTIDALEWRYGFQQYTFETPFQASADFTLTEDLKNGNILYLAPKTTIGKADANVYLDYYNGLLYKIILTTEGQLNSREMLGVFNAAYGQGSRPNKYIPQYFYYKSPTLKFENGKSEITDYGGKVHLTYDENIITGDATATFYSIPLRDKESSDRDASQKEAAGQV
jgi:hypothetical protein